MSSPVFASRALMKGIDIPRNDKIFVKILDAGLALFVEFGLRRTTMDDVAKKAGIGRATAYRRFSDKDQLIQTVIMREAQRELDSIEQDLQAINGDLEKLLESFVLAVTRAHAHPLWRRLLTADTDTLLPFITRNLWQLTAFFRGYLANKVNQARQGANDTDQSGEMIAELMLRLMQSMLLSPDGVMDPADEEAVRNVAEQCLRPLIKS